MEFQTHLQSGTLQPLADQEDTWRHAQPTLWVTERGQVPAGREWCLCPLCWAEGDTTHLQPDGRAGRDLNMVSPPLALLGTELTPIQPLS